MEHVVTYLYVYKYKQYHVTVIPYLKDFYNIIFKIKINYI